MTDNQFKTQQILLGLGEIYPQDDLIPKLRFFLEKLAEEDYSSHQLVSDLFVVLDNTGNYPALALIRQFVEATNSKDFLINFYKLSESLSYDPVWKNLKVITKFFELPNELELNCHNSILLLLEEKAGDPGYEYCKYLREVILEEDALEKIKKILDFFIFLYECPKIIQFKKAIDQYVKIDNDLQVWKYLMDCKYTDIIFRLKSLRAMFPEVDMHIAFSKSQTLSKLWVCGEINKLSLNQEIKNTLVLCGWYGVLPALMFEKIGENNFERIRSVDIDKNCEVIANGMNQVQRKNGIKFNAVTSDVYDLNYEKMKLPITDMDKSYNEEVEFDFFINTSCEHLSRFEDWYSLIPEGKLLLLQSNDFFDCDEHVNCMKSLEEFKESAPMSEVLYQGELKLEKYNRFMLIGRK